MSHTMLETCTHMEMEYETEMKPRILEQELGRVSSLNY